MPKGVYPRTDQGERLRTHPKDWFNFKKVKGSHSWSQRYQPRQKGERLYATA